MDPQSISRSTPDAQAAGFDAALEGLAQVFESLATLDLSAQNLSLAQDHELVKIITLAEAVGQITDLLRVRLAAQLHTVAQSSFGEQSIITKLGARNTTGALQQATQLSAATLNKRIKLGLLLDESFSISGAEIPAKYPAVAAGLDSGQLNVESAQLICQTLNQPTMQTAQVQPLVGPAETALVALATGTNPEYPFPQDYDQLKYSCRKVADYIDQDGPHPKGREPSAQRNFWMGKEHNGLVSIGGKLIPQTAALLARLLEAASGSSSITSEQDQHGTLGHDPKKCSVHQADYLNTLAATHNDSAQPSTTQPDAVQSDDSKCPDSHAAELSYLADRIDPRTPGNRRHDSLSVLLGAIARHPDAPLLAGAPVTVLIQTTAAQTTAVQTTEAQPAAVQPAAVQLPATPMPSAGVLYDHHGGTIAIDQDALQHAGCSGWTQQVELSERGVINHISSPNRLFTAYQKRALILRDGGCAIPNCMVPGTMCEAHHVVEWSHGGPTTVSNGALLCFYHHQTINTSGWHLKMIDAVPHVRAPHWLEPNGTWFRIRPPSVPPQLPGPELQALCQKLFDKDRNLILPRARTAGTQTNTDQNAA
ncbi:DUF222 domain-containing protein [Jonesiaceae bacterium BS-20]|uniref:DUF222 domain-containing protein n=1 Tax=Jonesiaceae bacterium BS-20 TaxID=3120821 RepID=A0AAU7DTA0_9MICO